MLEGSFCLSTMPDQVIFYLEGPPAGTDLLKKSVVISSPSSTACDVSSMLCAYFPLYLEIIQVIKTPFYFCNDSLLVFIVFWNIIRL